MRNSIMKIIIVMASVMICVIMTGYVKGQTRVSSSYVEISAAPPKAEEETEAMAEPEHQSLIMSRDWDIEDGYMLAKIAMAEAEGEDTEGKALVIMVVLNRVWNEEFPDTIEDVIFQKVGGSYQFSVMVDGGRWWNVEPDEDCWAAVDMVMNGWDESEGATYFEATFCEETWQRENLQFLFQHGGHLFYREVSE